MSFLELLVILAITLIVVGPQRLPAVAYTLGKYLERIKLFIGVFKQDFNHELKLLELKRNIARAEMVEPPSSNATKPKTDQETN